MNKPVFQHNMDLTAGWFMPPSISMEWGFWLSIGADPDKRWSKTYLNSVLSI